MSTIIAFIAAAIIAGAAFGLGWIACRYWLETGGKQPKEWDRKRILRPAPGAASEPDLIGPGPSPSTLAMLDAMERARREIDEITGIPEAMLTPTMSERRFAEEGARIVSKRLPSARRLTDDEVRQIVGDEVSLKISKREPGEKLEPVELRLSPADLEILAMNDHARADFARATGQAPPVPRRHPDGLNEPDMGVGDFVPDPKRRSRSDGIDFGD